MDLELEGAPHPYLIVQGRRRWVVIRRGDGRVEDLGFVECHHLMPSLGSIGAETSRLVCSPEDMRPAYMFVYEGRKRFEWAFLPKRGDGDVPRDPDGHPLKIEGVECPLGPETWFMDDLAREQLYGATNATY